MGRMAEEFSVEVIIEWMCSRVCVCVCIHACTHSHSTHPAESLQRCLLLCNDVRLAGNVYRFHWLLLPPTPYSNLWATHCLVIWLSGGLCAPDQNSRWVLSVFSKLSTGSFYTHSHSSESHPHPAHCPATPPPPHPPLPAAWCSGDLRDTPGAVTLLQSYDLNHHGCSAEVNSKPRMWWEPLESPSLQSCAGSSGNGDNFGFLRTGSSMVSHKQKAQNFSPDSSNCEDRGTSFLF